MRKHESYKCSVCGNEIEVSHVGGGTLVCCGKDMECSTENLTMVNLLKAFAGESMARNKYEFYAKAAIKEGYNDIAAHFMRVAHNEVEHAKLEFKMHHMLMDGKELGDTLDNLQDAINGESYENHSMYPDFAAIAKEDGNKEATALFKKIGNVEVEHEKLFEELKKRLESGQEFQSDNEDEEWICEVCGHIHRGKKAPDTCPLCKHPQAYQSRLVEKK